MKIEKNEFKINETLEREVFEKIQEVILPF